MSALDELLRKWRDNPDSGTTLALCTYLGGTGREELVREVGTTSEAWHKQDADVMLAVGRMYLDAMMLTEAQTALVTAGKLSRDSAGPYRYLGEVLLRRGDAVRAEKVFARALDIGPPDADTRMWHDRAVVYVGLQKRVGMQAVADEIARTVPKTTSIPPPTRPVEPVRSEPPASAPAPRASNAIPSPPPGGLPRLPSSIPPPLPPPPKPSQAPQPPQPLRADAALPMFGEEEPTRVYADGPPPMARDLMPSGLEEITQPNLDAAPRSGPTEGGAAGPVEEGAVPAPETVLDHLSRVGIYERGGGAPPAWESVARERARGTWLFVVAIVLVIGSGYGGFRYARQVKEERLAQARQIEQHVAELLDSGKLASIRKTEEELSRVFELDSRSQAAALLWLKNRVLSALLAPGEIQGIESALHRCKQLGVLPHKVAFGRIASFLVEGDLGGAAALLARWDKEAKDDPYYQLLAAVMLERAGDLRAIERYEKAIELDGDLVVARLLHAQLLLLERGATEAGPAVEKLVEAADDRPSVRAVRALEWVVSDTAEPLPDSARLTEASRKEIIVPLRAIGPLVDSARADSAEESLERLAVALRASATPSMAAWIGFRAIELGDEALARKAALRALSYSATYDKARALAARVALLGARLDEAKKAIQQLDPQSAEVRVVRTAVAYETLDLGDLEAVLESLGSVEAGSPLFGLSKSLGVALGASYPSTEDLESMAVPSVTWGRLIALDATLDQGDLDRAQAIVDDLGEAKDVSLYALRRARLARYRGEAAEAAELAKAAVPAGNLTARMLVELFDALLAADETATAREVLAKYPAVLGPMTDWLKARLDVADGHARRGQVVVQTLEPPPPDAPLLYRVMAAQALAEAGDKRARAVIGTLLGRVRRHPDVLAAAKTAGLLR